LSATTDSLRNVTTALYRRYRPQDFAEVIGQEHVTEPLMQALRSGRIGHAYLFSGPRGCGKTTSARILARCLNCEQGPTATPCGECDSCRALATGGTGSVDVIEIDAASHGGVDDARDLREKAAYGPAQSRFKVYIIDEAHMVTPQGFNALLKIVEEPPEHVKFVFATTEPDKVIGTIRSRTHHYPFRLVPPARLQDYLEELCEREGVAVEPGVLSFVIRAGGGSVRDSLSVLDQLIAGSNEEGLTYAGAAALLGFTEGELLDATVDAIAAGDGAGVFRQVDRVIETGQDPRRFVEDVLERFRDLIVLSAVSQATDAEAQISAVLRGLPEDQITRMRQQAGAFGPGQLSYAADIVNAGLTEMTGATSPRLQLELLCARLLLPTGAGEHGYAARLDRLERRLDVGGGIAAPIPAQAAASQMPVGETVSGEASAQARPVGAAERRGEDGSRGAGAPAGWRDQASRGAESRGVTARSGGEGRSPVESRSGAVGLETQDGGDLSRDRGAGPDALDGGSAQGGAVEGSAAQPDGRGARDDAHDGAHAPAGRAGDSARPSGADSPTENAGARSEVDGAAAVGEGATGAGPGGDEASRRRPPGHAGDQHAPGQSPADRGGPGGEGRGHGADVGREPGSGRPGSRDGSSRHRSLEGDTDAGRGRSSEQQGRGEGSAQHRGPHGDVGPERAGLGRGPDDEAPSAAAGGGGRSLGPRGGVDTDMIRRNWPDVLQRIFGIRRVTWTFLSEHAQVLDYDGSRLLLGLSTAGLATTFRNGPHAEVVRQALSEALGVDTRVEGIPAGEGPAVLARRGGGPVGPTGGGPGDHGGTDGNGPGGRGGPGGSGAPTSGGPGGSGGPRGSASGGSGFGGPASGGPGRSRSGGPSGPTPGGPDGPHGPGGPMHGDPTSAGQASHGAGAPTPRAPGGAGGSRENGESGASGGVGGAGGVGQGPGPDRGGPGRGGSDIDAPHRGGRDLGPEHGGHEVSGRDVSGRDVSGRDVSGRDVSGQDRSGVDGTTGGPGAGAAWGRSGSADTEAPRSRETIGARPEDAGRGGSRADAPARSGERARGRRYAPTGGPDASSWADDDRPPPSDDDAPPPDDVPPDDGWPPEDAYPPGSGAAPSGPPAARESSGRGGSPLDRSARGRLRRPTTPATSLDDGSRAARSESGGESRRTGNAEGRERSAAGGETRRHVHPGAAQAREAIRAARRNGHHADSAPTRPRGSDDDISVDDEDIADASAVGQPVIADVLGGVVIAEEEG